MAGDAPIAQRITTADGLQLAVHRIGPPDGIPILLAPGTFSNSRFWLGTRGVGFARTLVEHGYEAWVLDFRGHGDSPRPARGQRWNFDDWGRLDIPAAVAAIADTARRPFLIGHSAGGVSILAALAAEPGVRQVTRGAVIAATPLPWLQRWRRIAAYALRFGSRHANVFPARLLGLGPEDELPGVMEQWMDWNIRGVWSGNDGADYIAGLRSVDLPMLFLGGQAERRFAPVDAVHGLYDVVGSSDKQLVIAGRGQGFARDYDHVDLIASRDAQMEVWPLMLRWLARRHASPT
jgi:predicted alpha/beta hydrolase